MLTIRNPVEWSVDQLKHAADAVEAAGRAGRHMRENLHSQRRRSPVSGSRISRKCSRVGSAISLSSGPT